MAATEEELETAREGLMAQMEAATHGMVHAHSLTNREACRVVCEIALGTLMQLTLSMGVPRELFMQELGRLWDKYHEQGESPNGNI